MTVEVSANGLHRPFGSIVHQETNSSTEIPALLAIFRRCSRQRGSRRPDAADRHVEGLAEIAVAERRIGRQQAQDQLQRAGSLITNAHSSRALSLARSASSFDTPSSAATRSMMM